MDKNKLVFPITILLSSLILGGFIYASQVVKQKSIEKQQEIKLEAEAELRKGELEEKEKNKMLLEDCFDVAKQEHKKSAALNNDFVNECLHDGYSIPSECNSAFSDGIKENENKEKESREECLKIYPQK